MTAAFESTGQVALQLLAQSRADHDPATLGPLGADVFQKGIDGLQRSGAHSPTDQVEFGEGRALSEHRREEGVGAFELAGINERGDVFTQMSGFVGIHM